MNRVALRVVALNVPAFSASPRSSGAQGLPYRATVVFPARTATLRWMLLSVLAFAVIGMHSLVTAHAADAPHAAAGVVGTSAAAASGPVAGPTVGRAETECCPDHEQAMNHSGASGHSHDPLHLCLAVLVALAGLVLGWLLWRRGRTTTRHRGPDPAVTSAGRGPPRARCTNDLLSSLCVLRL